MNTTTDGNSVVQTSAFAQAQPLPELSWRQDAPPADGTPILALGQVTEQWNAHTIVVPFAKAIRFETDCASPCWVDLYSGLSLAEEPGDTITVQAWMLMPSIAYVHAEATA